MWNHLKSAALCCNLHFQHLPTFEVLDFRQMWHINGALGVPPEVINGGSHAGNRLACQVRCDMLNMLWLSNHLSLPITGYPMLSAQSWYWCILWISITMFVLPAFFAHGFCLVQVPISGTVHLILLVSNLPKVLTSSVGFYSHHS